MTAGVSAARLRAVLLLSAVLFDAALLTLVLVGAPALAATLAGVAVTTVSVLFIHTHRALSRAADRLIALDDELLDALTDPVTGLGGRRVLDQHLDEARGRDVSLALLDVDDLHGINTAHGHQGGDDYLHALAARLHRAVPGDLVTRLGGDEFVILSARDPFTLADAIDAALAAPVTVGHRQLPLAVSTGITRTGGRDPHVVLGEADRAMYTAKHRGLRVAFYDGARDGRPAPAGERPTVRPRDQHSAARHADDDD